MATQGAKSNSEKTSKKRVRKKSSTPKNKDSKASPKELENKSDNPEFLLDDGEGIETNIACSGRKELPEIEVGKRGPKCGLETMVHFQPERYAKWINYVRNGARPNTSVAAIGVGVKAYDGWIRKGREDIAQDVDSIYSRLVKDIYAACGVAAVECESEVKATDPKLWLSRGPGRLFGDHWSKDHNKALPASSNGSRPRISNDAQSQQSSRNESEEIVDAVFSVSSPGKEEQKQLEDQSDNSQSTQILSIKPEDELEALEIWENIGLITMSPELKEAFKTKADPNYIPEPEVIIED